MSAPPTQIRPRLLITRRWPDDAIRAASARFDLVRNESDTAMPGVALASALREFDAICPTITDRFDSAMFSQPNLRVKILANFGAGTEHIDLYAAMKAGVTVTNTPDILTEATAELAIALMLMVARRASEGERQLRQGEWLGWNPTHLMGRELTGLHLGLVGFGRIGQQTAKLARALWRMRISYFSRSPAHLPPDLADARRHASLDRLLGEADVVSLHCPGGAQTRHLIDERALSAMKPGAILINTARGSVVDGRALASALDHGRIGGAGLDVHEHEPAIEPALLACRNAVLLPHLGSATVETRTRMGMRAVENLVAYFAGQPPRDRVA